MVDLIGQILLNRYRVDSFLGRGGMAEVYKVWDAQRAVFLAMKLLRDDLAEDKIFLRRFRREAKTLEKLQHPNIVRFYGLEQDKDLAFMLMDYVEGTTLRKEIYKLSGPMPHGRVSELMRPVCSALHYAHQMGMVHCDIKPGNIMLHFNGTVLVADFGIARMTDAATSTMIGAGTPAYMAPEQARGLDPSPQTDIYALGINLYEMLTGGERPFTGDHAETTGSTSEKVLWEQQHLDALPPSHHNPEITPKLDAVMLCCLSKDADNRYRSVLDLLNGLEIALAAVPEPVQLSNQKDQLCPDELERLADIHPQGESEMVGEKTRRKGASIGLVLMFMGIIALSIMGIWYSYSYQASIATTTSTNQAVMNSTHAQNQTATAVIAQFKTKVAAEATATTQARDNYWATMQAGASEIDGPYSGSLIHDNDNNIEAFYSKAILKDFIVEAEFENPYSDFAGDWDYGFNFRDEGGNNQYWLIITSGALWQLLDGDRTNIDGGRLPIYFNTDAFQWNRFKLVCQGEKGWLYVNGEFIAELNISAY